MKWRRRVIAPLFHFQIGIPLLQLVVRLWPGSTRTSQWNARAEPE